jgi:molybdopterin-guanine dinucleotide biosynthesis protein MobB
MRDGAFDFEPVLAICGWSGSGKTTLLERVIPHLTARGLRVAVIKHDAHGIEIDREGKDSARFFAVGADVVLRAPGEGFTRSMLRREDSLERAVAEMLTAHDFVLVEGHKDTALPKIWCHLKGEDAVPGEVAAVIEALPFGDGRLDILLPIIDRRLTEALDRRSLLGGVLIGGQSRRMGSPKHRLMISGESLLTRVAGVLDSRTDGVVILGRGLIPEDACNFERLPDAPGTGQGPLAGMMTAHRWAPRASWVVAACDMPGVSAEAFDWLVEQRRPGRWAIIPRDDEGRLQPTLALYEPQAGTLFRALIEDGRRAVRHVAEWPGVWTPPIPGDFAQAWVNVNTPEDLDAFVSGSN